MNSFKNAVAGSFALVATFVTVAAATPLHAAPVSVAVAYGDLDLSSDAGASALRTRISRAARFACDQDAGGNRLNAASCRDEAVKAAQARVAMKNGETNVKLAAR